MTALSTPPEAREAFRIADFGLEKTQSAEPGAQEKDRFVFPLFPAMDRSYVSYMVWGEGNILLWTTDDGRQTMF